MSEVQDDDVKMDLVRNINIEQARNNIAQYEDVKDSASLENTTNVLMAFILFDDPSNARVVARLARTMIRYHQAQGDGPEERAAQAGILSQLYNLVA